MIGSYIDLGNPLALGHPLANGLIHCWLPLPNNRGGNRLHDLKGTATGTLATSPSPQWVPGRGQLGALRTTDSDDKITIAATAVTNFTVAAVVTPYAPTTLGLIIGESDTAPALYNWNDSTFNFYNANNCQSGAITTGRTYVLVGVNRDGVERELFMDGVSQATGVAIPSMTANRIGGDDAGQGFNGIIEGCWLWNRAFSDTEARDFSIEARLQYPTLIRRFSRRVYSFGPVAAGGGITGPLIDGRLIGGVLTKGRLVRAG